jgi:hypothetical protein
LPISNEITYSRKTNPEEFSGALAVFAVYHVALLAVAKPNATNPDASPSTIVNDFAPATHKTTNQDQ